MNKLEKMNNGFTLIEITVALIILGIIATIGLPGIFAQIERHRAQEAIANLQIIRSSIETCGEYNAGDFTNCSTWAALGIDIPNEDIFFYDNGGLIMAGSTAFGIGTYSIRVERVRISTNRITITRSPGAVSCAGEGEYLGVCS